MDKNLIPPGNYCYCIDYLRIPEMVHNITKIMETGEDIPYVSCPYYTTKKINNVCVPWCNYLDQGGISNDHTEEEIKLLSDHYGDFDKASDALPLDLLWDSCKECDENKESITIENMFDYLVKIKTKQNE
jgi:hypothetical protein